jgi:hypothetical protein
MDRARRMLPLLSPARLNGDALARGGARLLVAAAVVLALPGPQGWGGNVVQAQARPLSLERSVKAAFLYKFLGYAEFPSASFADAEAPLVIGVAGSDELAAELTRMVVGRNVNGRTIVVRTIKDQSTIGELHLLFIAGDENRAAAMLKAHSQHALLTVTETERGLQLGSVINFKIVDDHVRFDVSLDAAGKNNVKLSSRLLTVAHLVQKGGS